MLAEVYTPRLLILYGTILLLLSRVIKVFFYKIKGNKINIKRELLIMLFVFYIICLISITLLPITIYYVNTGYTITPNINLIPLKGMLDFISFKLFVLNTLGNLILFIPFIIFIEILKEGKIKLSKGLFWVFICSIIIESFQYIEMYLQVADRVVDINDIILNVLGGFIGYYIYISLFKKIKLK